MFNWLLADMQYFLQQGGAVLYGILFNLLLLLYLIFERLSFLIFKFQTIKKQAQQLWQAQPNTHDWHAQTIREAFLQQQHHQFAKYQYYIKVLIMICPLLGLLGTVTGMIGIFNILTMTEGGNIRLMAAGIAQATIPTFAGMFVAIIGILLQSKLNYFITIRLQQLALLLPFKQPKCETDYGR